MLVWFINVKPHHETSEESTLNTLQDIHRYKLYQMRNRCEESKTQSKTGFNRGFHKRNACVCVRDREIHQVKSGLTV